MIVYGPPCFNRLTAFLFLSVKTQAELEIAWGILKRAITVLEVYRTDMLYILYKSLVIRKHRGSKSVASHA